MYGILVVCPSVVAHSVLSRLPVLQVVQEVQFLLPVVSTLLCLWS